MQCFDFILPVHDNAGKPTKDALRDFLTRCVFEAGGYTACPVVYGVWKDEDGIQHCDTSDVIRVACHDDIKTRLLDYAFELWPDQKAIAVIKHGDMMIYDSYR